MSDRMALIRAGHTEVWGGICGLCSTDWPCDTAVVLEQLAAERARAEAAEGREARLRECVKDALDCLPRALDGSSPFSLSQRAEVMLAIESLNRALAGTPEGEQREGQGDE